MLIPAVSEINRLSDHDHDKHKDKHIKKQFLDIYMIIISLYFQRKLIIIIIDFIQTQKLFRSKRKPHLLHLWTAFKGHV